MARGISGNLSQLLPHAVAHSTVEIRRNDGTVQRVATDALNVGGNAYAPDLRYVGEIAQSRGRASDRVSVTMQNVDKTFGLEILSDLRRLDFAETIVGRYLYKASNPALNAWVELYRGKLVNAQATDTEAKFAIVDALTAAGYVVSMRQLEEDCTWVFGDPNTCGYTGPLLTCDHKLNSPGGCLGRQRTKRYGGWKFPKAPTSSFPGSGGNTGSGTGGNTGGDTGGGPRCFTGETMILMAGGAVKRIDEIEAGDSVVAFDPATGEIKNKTVVRRFHHFAPNYFSLKFGDFSLNVTPEHRFWTQNGWLAADNFSLKQTVFRLENFRDTNRELPVLTESKWETYKPVSVYNFEVADFHTYFAGGFAVSNAKSPIEIIVS